VACRQPVENRAKPAGQKPSGANATVASFNASAVKLATQQVVFLHTIVSKAKYVFYTLAYKLVWNFVQNFLYIKSSDKNVSI
jgi:hypothetical protein